MALALLQLTTLQALPGGSLNTWERPCLQLTILLHLYFPALKQNPRCNRMYRRSVWKCTYHAVALLTDRWHTASTYSPLFYIKRSTVDINYWGTASQLFCGVGSSVCYVRYAMSLFDS